MPDLLAALWPPLYAGNPVLPVAPDRACGCSSDPLVFGHHHVTEEGLVTL